MQKTKYERLDGCDYYMCDSIPTDDIIIQETNTKKIKIRPNSKLDFNLELQKLINVPETKEEKDNKFHHELQQLIDFYKNSRKYRDVNGNIIKKQKEENFLTPYQKMIKINEEIKTFYDKKTTENKIIYPLIVKNTKLNNKCIINTIKNNNSIKFNRNINEFYKIKSLKNLSHYNNLNIKKNTNNQSKELSQTDLNNTNDKKSLYTKDDSKLVKVYCSSYKDLNRSSHLKTQKDDSNINSNRSVNKNHYKITFNDINNWKLKLVFPDTINKQYQKREKTTNNILQGLKDYNLIQFNMNQLLKRDTKHKDKFILNTRKNSVVKKIAVIGETTNINMNYRNRKQLVYGRKEYTLSNIRNNKLNEYYNQTDN